MSIESPPNASPKPCSLGTESAGINLRIHAAREQAMLPMGAAQRWTRVDGSPWMERYDTQPDTLLRLPGLCDFTINPQGTVVEGWPSLALDQNACRQIYLNNVMPMALSRQGKLVLHASAVEVNDSALVFVGVSGRGKSTLATSFSHDGYALIVDDGLVVEARDSHALAMPGEHSVRLWRDSELLLGTHATSGTQAMGFTDKRCFPAGSALHFCVQPRPIRAVFLLGEDPQAPLSIRRLPPAQALIELIHYSFLLDIGNPAKHASLMRATAHLASSCQVSLLDYPRNYTQLPSVREAIFDHLGVIPNVL